MTFGLKINASKTHILVTDPTDDGMQQVTIDGKDVQRMDKFKFLGSIVTTDSNSTTDIKI